MKRALILFFVAVMALTLISCGGGSDTNTANNPPAGDSSGGAVSDGGGAAVGEPEYGGTFRILGGTDSSEAFGLPWEQVSGSLALVIPYAEPLTNELADGSAVPGLAVSWEIDPDNNEIRFKLREGVKFTDGSDFNAEVAQWNYLKAKEKNALQPTIIDIEVRGEYEIALKLQGFSNSVLNAISSHAFGMISKENYEENGEEYARNNPVGTGPFILSERVPGSRVVFTRNDNYWDEGKPYLDKLEFVAVVDTITANAALSSTDPQEAGDMAETYSAEQLAMIMESGAPVYVEQLEAGPICLLPSSVEKDSPLAIKEVRQAISYAINRDALCAARGFGYLTPSKQLIPSSFRGHITDPGYELTCDPDKAKELLTQAGYPNGFKTKLIVMPGLVDSDSMVSIQGMLGAVGIDAEIETPQSGAASEAQREWSGLLAMHVRSLANITSTFRLYFDPEYVFYPKVQRPPGSYAEDFLQSRTTVEIDNALVQKIHKMFMDDMTVIPVYDVYNFFVLRDTVHDTGHGTYSPGTQWLPADAWKSAN
jgi:peptide/nickel transport system substrate-binding protein